MKIRNIILLTIAIVSLCDCSKDTPEEPYSNKDIVEVNAQAALYFHTVFREAENAWAFINSKEYKPGTYADQSNPLPAVKNLIYNESTGTVTIDYNAWKTGGLLLIGTISVKFPKDSYQMGDMRASVFLTDFSIETHPVMGELTLQYRKVNNNDNDHYSYSVTNGAVHEKGRSMPVLISGSITNGQYERTEGATTILLQDDDEWAYSGTMTGILRNDPSLKYTNTVLAAYTTENGEERSGTVHYAFGCTTASSGVSQIKISDRPDIIYAYNCTAIDFLSVTRVD